MFHRIMMLAIVATVGCASSGGQSDATRPPARTARREANVISEVELRQSSARNALEAVELLRPDWLRGRGAASLRDPTPAEIVVYINDQRYGPLRSLEQFNVSSIESLRFLGASEATTRFGSGHGGGVISVTTK